MADTKQFQRRTERRRGVLARVLTTALLLAAIGLLISSASCSGAGRAASAPVGSVERCSGSRIQTVAPGANAAIEVALDGSVSTRSSSLRRQYVEVAQATVEQAVTQHAALRIVVFGSSGVGARVVFSASFAPVSTVMAFNLAAANRLRCLADAAIADAFRASPPKIGSDVAGATAAAVGWVRAVVKSGGMGAVTVATDGCQSPAKAGPNARLTDLCGVIRHGVGLPQILEKHAKEFSLGDARGIRLQMVGLGVGRDAADASTSRAQEVVAFWQLVCARAHAASCLIGSTL